MDDVRECLEASKVSFKRVQDALQHVTPAQLSAYVHQGATAVHLAIWTGSAAVLRLVLSRGADAARPLRDQVPTVAVAVETDRADLVAELIRWSPPLSDVGPDGKTALHLACSRGQVKMVGALVKAGADMEAKDAEGMTPAQVAKDFKVKRLLRALADVVVVPQARVLTRPAQLAAALPLAAGSGADGGDADAAAAAGEGQAGEFAYSEEVLEAALSMGYQRDDCIHALYQLQVDGQSTDDIGLLVDTLTNLEELKKAVNLPPGDDLTAGDAAAEDGDDAVPVADVDDGEPPAGEYALFVPHDDAHASLMTFAYSETGERAYCNEDGEWEQFPFNWYDLGRFEKQDDPQAQQTLELFTRADGEEFLSRIYDGVRYYADEGSDDWIVFPDDWEGTFEPFDGGDEGVEEQVAEEEEEEEREFFTFKHNESGIEYTTCIVGGTERFFLMDGEWLNLPPDWVNEGTFTPAAAP